MTDTLHVIANTNGANDRIIVYETRCGEVLYDGLNLRAGDLFNILNAVNGGYDSVKFHELSDEDMNEWNDRLYGQD